MITWTKTCALLLAILIIVMLFLGMSPLMILQLLR